MNNSLIEMLGKAESLQDRRSILQEELNKRKSDLERLNGGTVLDLEEMDGIQTGDLVEYTNALGERRRGYVSHFFIRTEATRGFAFAESLTALAASKDERFFQPSRGDVIPVMVSLTSGGYSTAHGYDPIVPIRPKTTRKYPSG